MTDTADNTSPPAPGNNAPTSHATPEETSASPQPPAKPGDSSTSRSNRCPWRDPGTMTGAITAAVLGGLIAALMCAWLARVIHF